MKKRILAVSLILILVAIRAQGTLSYYTAEKLTHNIITTGKVEISLGEEFPEAGVSGVLPSRQVPKRVWVENIGSVSAWVRVLPRLTIRSEKGENLPDKLPNGEPVVELTLLPGWELGQDGCFGYQRPLQPGEKTEDMIRSVTFHRDIGNEYQGASVELTLTAYGVQSDHNGTAVSEAQGWPKLSEP